ncbi:hypothetical protein SAMN04487886_10836 [Clostridium sp. DSM 8431]|uniref:YcxB family protein n=1 Tax=Clostridium sp. DSM 8431 TaxID=1761781 RepID=UPI0008E07FB9|nr:YcxB family protein [Clostridium sp. DSM 8431]SFU63656.1 hypothetical protein SAMN04487886_10836 [Clostridium sp. DSM 8431]
MEVHFQFNGKEYLDTILKDNISSKKFKKNLICEAVVFLALVFLFALRIRYVKIRHIIMIIGVIVVFFVKKVNTIRLKKEFRDKYNIKDNDVRITHIKLDDNFIIVSQIMEESKYSYEAVKEAYVIGDYLYIKFIDDRRACVHARAFQDGESAQRFVNDLEKKTGLKVYRRKDEIIK